MINVIQRGCFCWLEGDEIAILKFQKYLDGFLDVKEGSEGIINQTEIGKFRFLTPLKNFILSHLNSPGKRRKAIPHTFTIEEELYDSEEPDLSEPVEIDKNFLKGITLRDYQVEAVRELLTWKKGILWVPPGGGKTEVMAYLVKFLQCPTIIIVPSVTLVHQTVDRLESRGVTNTVILDRKAKVKSFSKSQVLVGTINSFYNKVVKTSAVSWVEWFDTVGMVLLDEAHHSASASWFQVINSFKTEYRIAVSATPFYQDKDNKVRDLTMIGLFRKVLYRVPVKKLVDDGYLALPRIYFLKTRPSVYLWEFRNWSTIYRLGIIKNNLRNDLIVQCAGLMIHKLKTVLILVTKIAHGEDLAKKIAFNYEIPVHFKTGKFTSVYRKNRLVETVSGSAAKTWFQEQFDCGNVRLVIATSVFDEGADLPALDVCIFSGGQKSSVKTVQRFGRPLRKKEGDNTAIIIDFWDSWNPITLSHSRKRSGTFETLGFKFNYFEDYSQLVESEIDK